MAFWNRRKSLDVVEHEDEGQRLRRSLSWPHLVGLGVGAIVGTGIFVLIGTGVHLAGPGVLLSFAIVGVVCACAALAYAEVSTLIPASGSAYTYTYSVLGELLAWIVGWSLILEYSLVVTAVAIGWSGYASTFLGGAGLDLPQALLAGPFATAPDGTALGGAINLPAIFIIGVVTLLLIVGTRESATVNAVLVLVKLAALGLFVALTFPAFDSAKLDPFLPYGFGGPFQETGVMAAAAIIFFAFYGFDAISTAAEETKNPGRDLPIGILGSMVLCTLIYMVVAAAAVGAVPFRTFANSPETLALILREIGQPTAAKWIAGAAVIAFPTVLLAFLFGQSRIFYVMARDGLLPERLSRVNPKTRTPVLVTVVTAVVLAVLAGLLPIDKAAALANAGTLAAFIAVSTCLLVLRARSPQLPRVFRAPLAWPVGLVAIGGCLYLFASLPRDTQLLFFVWNVVGLVVYGLYGMRRSRLATA
jgi:APA family basic amino acid/polyamine antiporter